MPHELSFSCGDVMIVHQRFFESPLWEAELPNGQTGFVPRNKLVSFIKGEVDPMESKDLRIEELEKEMEVTKKLLQQKTREIQVNKAATSSWLSYTATATATATAAGKGREGGACCEETPGEGRKKKGTEVGKGSLTGETRFSQHSSSSAGKTNKIRKIRSKRKRNNH